MCLPIGIISRKFFARKTNKLTNLQRGVLLTTSYSLYVRLSVIDSRDDV